jgi:hypothetical protein
VEKLAESSILLYWNIDLKFFPWIEDGRSNAVGKEGDERKFDLMWKEHDKFSCESEI